MFCLDHRPILTSLKKHSRSPLMLMLQDGDSAIFLRLVLLFSSNFTRFKEQGGSFILSKKAFKFIVNTKIVVAF